MTGGGTRWRRAALAWLVMALMAGAAACGGGSASGPAPTPTTGASSGVSGAPGPDAEAAASLRVDVAQGRLQGRIRNGVRFWGDVPYAAPPVDDLRWRAPEPAPTWSGVRDATSPGPACYQPKPYFVYGAAHVEPKPGTSEDCLHVDVVRPDDSATALPVMVWLHGGGFFEGSAASQPFLSSGLVDRGIIVVSVDYRLGRLGFFAHPGLGGDVANFGLLDQVAALRWVRANIAAFGGDPDRVTVAGESAGGMSVNALMAMPVARGLFQGAITESGLGAESPYTLAEARRTGEHQFPNLDAAQLRALPARDILSSRFNVFNGDAPILDGVLPQRVADTFAEHREAPVPYLVGTNSDEFQDDDFRRLSSKPLEVKRIYGGQDHAALVRAYGGQRRYDRYLLNDLVFSGPALRLATEHASLASTYRYRFGVDPAGSGHASELPYVFDAVTGSARQQRLADQVADYWAAFVRTGRPDADGLPSWPRADADHALMTFTPRGPVVRDDDAWATRLALTAN